MVLKRDWRYQVNRIENTPENKEIFNGLYAGQYVQRNHNWLPHTTVTSIINDKALLFRGYKVNTAYTSKDWYLELTHLSQISDEDADELSMVGLPDRLYDYLWGAPTGKAIAKSIECGRQNNIYYPNFRMADAFDFLRSKGYYVGDGTEIEYGWCKLRESQDLK